MFSQGLSIVLLLTSIATLSSCLPTLPDSLRIPFLPNFNAFYTARLDTSDSPDGTTTSGTNIFHTLTSLNLPILPDVQTLQLTRLTNLNSSLSPVTSTTHLHRRYSLATNPGGTLLLHATGSTFLAPITIGTQTFNVVVDTGSSDTWVARSDFTCVDVADGAPQPQSQCAFGGTYDVSKEPKASNAAGSRFKKLANVNFNVTYGDGEYLTGVFGDIDVTLAGIKVPNQQVALAKLAGWDGDGYTSGILGLAYPALTGAYSGTNPRNDRYCQHPSSSSLCNQMEYLPVLMNMFAQNLTAAVFAVALSRDESNSGKGGYLSIGGVMDLGMVGVKGGSSASFASTNVRMLKGDGEFRYYLVAIDGVVVLPIGASIPSRKRGRSVVDGDVDLHFDVDEEVDRKLMRRNGTGNDTLTAEEEEEVEAEEASEAGGMGGGASASTNMNVKRATTTTSSRPTTSISTSSSSTSTTSSTSMAGTLPGSSNLPMIIDTGTTLSFLPPTLIRRYLSMFSPPGTYDSATGFWFISCTAQVPPLGIKIGGKTFWHNPKDLVKRFDQAGRCISGVQENTIVGGVNILGDVWLDSVLVVFDLRNGTDKGIVRVAARREYTS